MPAMMPDQTSHSLRQIIKRFQMPEWHTRIHPSRDSLSNITTAPLSQTPNASLLPYTHGLQGVTLDLDRYLLNWLWGSIAVLALFILVCRTSQLFSAHLRHVYSLSADTKQQNYWKYDKSSFWPKFKQLVLYAPLFKKLHNKEIRLSSAVNVGTLPSRLHALILILYVASNITYCCILDYRNQNKAALIAEVRGRTGVLATANMIPLVLFAGRNNPAIPLLKVSFDTFNLLHRYIGRIVVVEAIAHTIAWGANSVHAEGLSATMDSLGGSTFLQFGLAAVIAMTIILVQSPSIIRHAFYEIFLHIHQFMAFAAVLGVYVHLETAKLPALPYIRAVIGIWIAERLLRLFRLLYLNLSRRYGATKVLVEALPGEACRVTFALSRHVRVRPGSHVYAYLPRISWWMSHPFSVAWTNKESEPPTGLQPDQELALLSPACLEKQTSAPESTKAPTTIALVMAARTGMTRKLYNLAAVAPNRTLQMSGYIEGPYAGHDSLASYGTVLLFAGGAGITHHLVQIRHLIASATARTVATRRVVLVWSVRNVEMLTWVRPWMDEILHMEGRREVLRMQLFVTKPREAKDLVSPSATVKLFPSRCKPGLVLDQELSSRIGATAVSVCGPGAFADDVRAAVRARLHWGTIDFFEEAFTW